MYFLHGKYNWSRWHCVDAMSQRVVSLTVRDNFKLKLWACAQSITLGTRTEFQLEIIIRITISAHTKLKPGWWQCYQMLHFLVRFSVFVELDTRYLNIMYGSSCLFPWYLAHVHRITQNQMCEPACSPFSSFRDVPDYSSKFNEIESSICTQGKC